MATQSLEFTHTSGLTLTAQLFAKGSDTVVATASSVTEATNRKRRYTAVFTDISAGEYLLVVFLAGESEGTAPYVLEAATGTYYPLWETQQPTPLKKQLEVR